MIPQSQLIQKRPHPLPPQKNHLRRCARVDGHKFLEVAYAVGGEQGMLNLLPRRLVTKTWMILCWEAAFAFRGGGMRLCGTRRGFLPLDSSLSDSFAAGVDGFLFEMVSLSSNSSGEARGYWLEPCFGMARTSSAIDKIEAGG